MINIESQAANGEVLVALSGSRDEIEERYNSFYNFGLVGRCELDWISDNYARLWTNSEKIKKYCHLSAFFKINQDFPGAKFRELKKLIKEEAARREGWFQNYRDDLVIEKESDDYFFASYLTERFCYKIEDEEEEKKDAIWDSLYRHPRDESGPVFSIGTTLKKKEQENENAN